eukprot:SAG11_NODE_24249_length_376_cov_0.740072_1_plen_40_part_10
MSTDRYCVIGIYHRSGTVPGFSGENYLKKLKPDLPRGAKH